MWISQQDSDLSKLTWGLQNTCYHKTTLFETHYRDHAKFNPLKRYVQKCLWCRCANTSVLSYKWLNMNYEELISSNSVWEKNVFSKANCWEVMLSSRESNRHFFKGKFKQWCFILSFKFAKSFCLIILFFLFIVLSRTLARVFLTGSLYSYFYFLLYSHVR